MTTEKLWTGFDNTKIMAERAVCDEVGQNIVDTYATKAEVTEKQDALPSSAANQFLQTNANNEITWGTLPEALDKVYIVTYGSSVSVNTVSAERQAGKAVFCSKGNALLPLQAIGSNICSFNGVIGAENSTGMNGLIMAHVELMATGMWGYSTISIPKPTGTSKTLTIDTDGTVAWTATPVIPQEMTGATAQGAGASGLVPAPLAGDQGKVLTGDGSWSEVEEYTDEYIDSLFAGNVVVIGGRSYPYVQIGNQLWLAENLDYKFEVDGSQMPIGVSGTPSTPSAWYYNNDEKTYGVNGNKYGLLYNWYAAKYLEDNKSTLLPEGWHFPSTTDWDALAETCGGASICGTKLKSTTGWSSGNGTDNYGFSVFPSSYYYGSFYDLGSYSTFWTSIETDSSIAHGRSLDTGTSLNSNDYYKTFGCSVRLVKDIT